MKPDDFVYHFVLARQGHPIARGERLATLAVDPARARKLGRRRLDQLVDAERRRWAAICRANGYVDGYSVATVAERGYRRTIYPGVAFAALATGEPGRLS